MLALMVCWQNVKQYVNQHRIQTTYSEDPCPIS
jgi:hypothetical protein